jgi:ribosomal protein S10
MFINIYIYSKNYKSIKHFLRLFSENTLLEKLKVTTYQNSTKKKSFTVLKSPHVNKTAQEHFEYGLYVKKLKLHSYKGLLLFAFIKSLKDNMFADLKFKVEVVNQPLKFRQSLKNKINPDNFSLIQNFTSLKLYMKIITNYGRLILKSK